MSTKSKEYEEGKAAAKEKKIPTENPYAKGTKQHEDWEDGLIDGSL